MSVRGRCSGDGGAIAILVAAFSLAMFAFAAIIVDLGVARSNLSDAQIAADAASLAGAGELYDTSGNVNPPGAIKAVKDSAEANFGTPQGDWMTECLAIPPPGWVQAGSGTDCIAFNDPLKPTRIQVIMPVKHSDIFFAGLFGVDDIEISARAQATARAEPVPSCALCLQGSVDTNGPIEVNGGGSFAAQSGTIRPGGSLSVLSPGIITFSGSFTRGTGLYIPDQPHAGPTSDPFAASPMPDVSLLSPATRNNVNCGPGGSLPQRNYGNVNVTGDCTASGTVVVTGLLRVRSGAQLTGASVTVYFRCGTRTSPRKCSNGESGGRIQIDAGGTVSIVGSPNAFSFVADRDNSRGLTINGSLSLSAGLYANSAQLAVNGLGTVAVADQTSLGSLRVRAGRNVNVTSPGGPQTVLGPRDIGLKE